MSSNKPSFGINKKTRAWEGKALARLGLEAMARYRANGLAQPGDQLHVTIIHDLAKKAV